MTRTPASKYPKNLPVWWDEGGGYYDSVASLVAYCADLGITPPNTVYACVIKTFSLEITAEEIVKAGTPEVVNGLVRPMHIAQLQTMLDVWVRSMRHIMFTLADLEHTVAINE